MKLYPVRHPMSNILTFYEVWSNIYYGVYHLRKE